MNAVNRACVWLVAVLLCASNPLLVSLASHNVLPPEHRLRQYTAPPVRTLEPVNISTSATDSLAPAVAVAVNLVHVVWEEENHVFHRMSRGGVWASSRSVATGEQPAIAIDAQGIAHAVFVNEFDENYEVYYCKWNGMSWGLPRNVSNTSGVSSAPGIAIDANGVLHVVWADNTPGYGVIYHAYWNGTYWLNEPIPYATGGAPTIAASPSGLVDVVWQDRDAADLPYEIYYSEWNGSNWSLPENLSDSPGLQSIIPNIAVDQNDQAHVTWQERVDGRYVIYYTHGRAGYWSIPEPVSSGTTDAYLPSAAVRPTKLGGVASAGALYVGWDESTVAIFRSKSSPDSEWSEPSMVLSDALGVADLQLGVDAAGMFHAVWSQRTAAENWEVFYQCLSKTVTLPFVLRRVMR